LELALEVVARAPVPVPCSPASFPATSETPGGVGIIAILLEAVMAVTGPAGLAERLARHLGTT
jgi:hypothetical protein